MVCYPVRTVDLHLHKQKDFGEAVNTLLRTLAEKASRKIDLTYPGDAFPEALATLMLSDLHEELGKMKWMGEDEGWDKAIKAVRDELTRRYGVRVK
jgi:hypothetical protein